MQRPCSAHSVLLAAFEVHRATMAWKQIIIMNRYWYSVWAMTTHEVHTIFEMLVIIPHGTSCLIWASTYPCFDNYHLWMGNVKDSGAASVKASALLALMTISWSQTISLPLPGLLCMSKLFPCPNNAWSFASPTQQVKGLRCCRPCSVPSRRPKLQYQPCPCFFSTLTCSIKWVVRWNMASSSKRASLPIWPITAPCLPTTIALTCNNTQIRHVCCWRVYPQGLPGSSQSKM